MPRASAYPIERWKLAAPSVSPELILRLQKYRDVSRVPAAIREAAEMVAAAATALVTPEVVVWRGPVRVVDEATVVFDETHRFHSRALARLLDGARDAYAVVLTIGAALEERAQAMFAEEMFLESVLLDTAAWASIDTLVRQIRHRLRDTERAAGRTVTHRLGPGHVDWAVAEQPAFLAVFGDTPLPVTLNDAACMVPQKSISGVFGVLPGR